MVGPIVVQKIATRLHTLTSLEVSNHVKNSIRMQFSEHQKRPKLLFNRHKRNCCKWEWFEGHGMTSVNFKSERKF